MKNLALGIMVLLAAACGREEPPANPPCPQTYAAPAKTEPAPEDATVYDNVDGKGYTYTGQGSGVNMDHVAEPLKPLPCAAVKS